MEVLRGHVVTGGGDLQRTGHHDRRVIDVAAAVRLRDALGLHDGHPADGVRAGAPDDHYRSTRADRPLRHGVLPMTASVEVEHCPNCGAPLELDDQGCCHFCGEHVTRSVTLDGLALPDPDGSIAKLAGHDQLALDAPGDVLLPLPAMPILAALDLLGFNPVVQGYLGDPHRAAAVRALAAAVREAGARVRHAGLADDVVSKGQKVYTPTEWWTFELAVDVLAACGALDGLDEDDQDSVRETVRLHDDMWARRTHRVLKHAEAGPEPLASLRAEIPHRH